MNCPRCGLDHGIYCVPAVFRSGNLICMACLTAEELLEEESE